MAEETATPQQQNNTNQPTAPAAPAAPAVQPQPQPQQPSSPQPQEASPFMDGTSWDQIAQQQFEAKPEPPKEFVFADGKTLAETDYRTPEKQAEQKPAEPAPSDTSAQKTDQATEPATGGTSGETDDEYAGLIKKYGNDPKAWAKAYLGNQRLVSQKDVEIRAYKEALANQFRIGQMPQQDQGQETVTKPAAAPPATPQTQPAQVIAPVEFKPDDELVQNLIAELADDPTTGIVNLLNTAKKTAHQEAQAAAAMYRQQEIQREQAAQSEAQQREAEEQNMKLLFNRVREMKLDDARRSGNETDVAKYGNASYQVDQAEYLDVYPRIKAEFDFIMENMAPKDGKLTEAHFKRARLLLDPPDIETLIRDTEKQTEQRVRAQVLKEIQDGQKNGNRVVIQPAAPVKSSTEIDLSDLQGDKDSLQDSVFSKMSDDQLAKLLEKAQLGYRGALASS